MNEKWVRQVRQSIENREETPPEGLLAGIRAEMQRRGLPMPQDAQPKRRKNALLLRRAAIASAAAAAVAVITCIFLYNGDAESPVVAQKAETVQSTPHTPQISSAPMDEKVVASPVMEAKAEKYVAVAEISQPSAPQISEASVETQAAAAETEQPAQPEAAAPAPTRKAVGAKASILAQNADYSDILRDSHSAEGRGTLALSVHCGGTMGQTQNFQGGMLTSAKPYGDATTDMENPDSDEILVGSPNLRKKARHNQPVKAGISVSYAVSPRWSVESGVDYSYLSSRFEADNGTSGTATTKQSLHYIGVPVKVAYSVVKTPKLRVYASAGGEIEKLVKGKTSTDSNDGTTGSHTSGSVSEGRPQFSVSAAAGAEYRLTESIGVYAEPGVSHHFNNHSNVENVYKKRPTSFSISLGLRFNVNK